MLVKKAAESGLRISLVRFLNASLLLDPVEGFPDEVVLENILDDVVVDLS